ncbi:GWxTD domain-containing protein [candidate division KSB1 bacterium]
MFKRISITGLITILILSFLTPVLYSQDYYNYYDEGVALLKGGDWIKAINKWMAGKTMLMAEGKADPRLGLAFIELITKRELEHFYAQASDMYMWGFSTEEYDRFGDVILQEGNRILPLVRDADNEEWKEAIKKDVSKVPFLIKKFWLGKDPTPTTTANERLLEHWKRIAFARDNYIRGDTTPYGTDDRGLIYVKYGEPQRTTSMLLGNNDAELAFWVTAADRRRDINSLFNTYPEVEIWIYGNLDLYQPVLYIFGRATGMPFHLYHGIEEFIPSKAYNNRFVMSFGGRYIAPGTFIQLMLYDDLRLVDYKFESRYNEIATIVGSPQMLNVNVLRGLRDRFKAEDASDPIKKFAPKEKSEYEFMINEVKMNNTIVRLLDENNVPKLAVLAISYPKYMSEDAKLTHTLIIRDNELNEITRFTDVPSDQTDNTSVFYLEHSDPDYNYTIGSMVPPPPPVPQDTVIANQVPRARYPSIGKETFENIVPLNINEEKLEASDLVYGVELPQTESAVDFPFPVLPTKQISKGDPLVVYFELYHLYLDNNSKSSYEIKFKVKEIEKDDKSLLDRFKPGFGSKTVMSQDSKFDAASRTVKDRIAFNISELEAGRYEFSIEVKDLVSKEKVERKGEFRVVK